MLTRLRSSLHLANGLVQVCATAIGLLLALGLDQWKTARAQQVAARQAEVLLVTELKLNREEVRREVEVMRSGLAKLRPVQQTLLRGGSLDKRPLEHLQLSMATLRSSAWQTGMATQAVTHLESGRLARLSEAFALQQDLDRVHQTLMTQIPTMTRLLLAKAPERSPNFAPDLAALISFFEMDLGSAQETLKAYETALAACQAP